MKSRISRDFREIVVMVGVTAGVWLFFKWLFVPVAPFFAAYFLVEALQPLIDRIRKKIKIHKGLLSVLILLLIVLIAGAGGYFLLRLLAGQLGRLFGNWQTYRELGAGYLEKCCCFVEETFHMEDGTLEQMFYDNARTISNDMKSSLIPGLMASSWGYMKETVSWFAALLVSFTAAVFLLNDDGSLYAGLAKMPYFSEIRTVKRRMAGAVRSFFKAQVIIMALIGAVCSLVFLMFGNQYCLLLGIGIGILDALPFFGTGIVLLPWALFQFIGGKVVRGIVLLVLYGVCSLIREFLEPKLMGKETGLPPIFFLAAVYWGMYLFGIWGVFIGPLAGLLMKEIIRVIRAGKP